MRREVRIERLGAGGDGVALNGTLFVPFTLPGELALVEVEPDGKHGKLIEPLEKSPERIKPVCPHFGVCGGCALQHLEKGAYLRWKREQVVAALRSRGLDAEVDTVRPVPLGVRRRAAFTLAKGSDGVVLGFRKERSHEVVDIEFCPVLSPRIVAALPALRATFAPLARAKGELRLNVTETESGLDLAVENARASPSFLATLASKLAALGVMRCTIDGEVVAMTGTPSVNLSGVSVKLPAVSFLQASAEAEAVLVELVRQAVGKAKRVADLFAGLGPFTFALAGTAEVDAFEEDAAALAALAEAARKTQGLKPVRPFRRDLFRSPLTPKELGRYDVVVFDPPRAGAAAQAEALAKSRVARIAAISCNPGTMARDLRTLVDGGYRIARVTPVDQFLFSPHIEMVTELER
jgi:23S rRNA (uracil1939-C5)-methyltransferase